MIGIVERLREWDAVVSDMKTVPRGLCSEAADEIERLRSAIAYFEDHPRPDHADMAMQYERGYADGSAEVERLRKALEEIATKCLPDDTFCETCGHIDKGDHYDPDCPVRIARAALNAEIDG